MALFPTKTELHRIKLYIIATNGKISPLAIKQFTTKIHKQENHAIKI